VGIACRRAIGSAAGRGDAGGALGTVAAGSNNWAVSAALSAQRPSGRRQRSARAVPSAPDLLASLHLHGPDYRVQGGMFRVSRVRLRPQRRARLGLHDGLRDAIDVYRIHRLPDDPTRYRTERGSGAITKQREELPARFGRTVTLEWETCDHGILYPDWHHHDGTPLAVRLVPSDLAACSRAISRWRRRRRRGVPRRACPLP
jgi:acyl-homoserine lactone acylase PvdQ